LVRDERDLRSIVQRFNPLLSLVIFR